MGARKDGLVICSGCGAEVRFGPASCPLCGESVADGTKPKPVRSPTETVDDYHEDLRRLREELDKLRKEIA